MHRYTHYGIPPVNLSKLTGYRCVFLPSIKQVEVEEIRDLMRVFHMPESAADQAPTGSDMMGVIMTSWD